MTDLEKFIELYKSIGIHLEPSKEEEGFIILILKVNQYRGIQNPLISGYEGFESDIIFDPAGKFISQRICE